MGLAILVHLTGLLNGLFISDSALYASITKEMVISGNYWDLTYDGIDWLDKPHFQFWVTAASYKIFGINAFAYKLPAILFTALALYYTFRFTRELYNRETALLAVLILACAEHLIISNNDVRAEPILTGLIIASIYHYHRLVLRYRWTSLLWASIFAAAAVMTKGLFTLIPIFGAVAGEILLKKQFRLILSTRWIFSLALIFLFVTPELYALYHQFDSQPDKIVFDRSGVSGIRFFLWDSQFGRFFNTGPIKGSGDPFFFIHTLLWAFIPWSLAMYYAFYKKIIQNIRKVNQEAEFYTISGAVLALLVFSLSGFQLPHYTNIIFPLLAILTADWIQRITLRREIRYFKITQLITVFLILALLFFIQILFRPDGPYMLAITAIALTGIMIIPVFRSKMKGKWKMVYVSALATILVNFYLNLLFYPELLQYQSGTQVARYANQHFPEQNIRSLGVLTFTTHFYADNEVKQRDIPALQEDLAIGEYLIFTSEPYLDSLRMANINFEIVKQFDHYHTTMVTGTFLNKKTRQKSLRKHYLLKSQ